MNTTPTIILVGCGQMGSAIARGLCSSDFDPQNLVLVDVDEERQRELADELGARIGEDDLGDSDGERVYLIAVKPWYIQGVLYARDFKPRDQIISVAAGVTTRDMRDWVGEGPAIIRTMPNTPCLVGAGVTGVFAERGTNLAAARWIFSMIGEVVELQSESHFDALTAISGCGPAYVFTILEALADGGVMMGLDRATARSLAIGTLLGATKLADESPEHTAALKDRVTSPGGATIAALRELERGNIRHTLMSAVEAAARRNRELGKKS